jgi:hypothetical protein
MARTWRHIEDAMKLMRGHTKAEAAGSRVTGCPNAGAAMPVPVRQRRRT